jgi:integrase
MPVEKDRTSKREVLFIERLGSPSWIRTNNLAAHRTESHLEEATQPQKIIPQSSSFLEKAEGISPVSDHFLEPIIRALCLLSPQNQELVTSLVRQLADRESISVELTAAPGLQTPAEGIPLWVAKLKAERYSERTIKMYQYNTKRYLGHDPAPTKLRIQAYLAERLEQVSPAMVSNERKALVSLFSFLHSEGLWPTNPLNGIRHVRVSYRERLCPEIEDVTKVLNSRCFRRRDTEKLRTLVLLLATTGLRISEATGILKQDIDFSRLEIRITGKGGKQRVVPLLPQTAGVLAKYIQENPDGSYHLFPSNGKTGHTDIYGFGKALKKACLRVGIRPFSAHQLRHFYATQMLRSGAKLEVVSRILGHTSVGTTADIYRHVTTAELHEEHIKFAPLNDNKALSEA